MVWSYIAGTAFTAVFAAVYNHFGHGVRSLYMDFAWIWPAAGCLAALILNFLKRPFPEPGRVFLACGTATLTAGSVLQGIFEIAGTNSPFVPVFFAAGGALCALSVIFTYKKSH